MQVHLLKTYFPTSLLSHKIDSYTNLVGFVNICIVPFYPPWICVRGSPSRIAGRHGCAQGPQYRCQNSNDPLATDPVGVRETASYRSYHDSKRHNGQPGQPSTRHATPGEHRGERREAYVRRQAGDG